MLEKGETPTALGRACEVRHDGEMAMALSSTDRLLAEQWVLLQNDCKLLSWMFYFFKNYYWISVKLGGSWIEEEFTRLWDLRPSVYLQRILALSSHPCPLISRLSLLSIVFIESQRHGDISLALGRGMHSDNRPKSLSLVMNCTVHQLFSFNSWTGKPENRFIFKHLTLL